MGINKRIQAVIDNVFNGSTNRLAESIGVKPSVISGYTGKRQSKPSYDVMERLVANANISPLWLLTGEGDMLKNTQEDYKEHPHDTPQVQEVHTPKQAEPRIEEQYVPYYSIEATAGVMELMDMSPEYEIGKIIVPNMPRCDGAVAITGDSMYPLLKSGDIVAFQLVHDINNIHFGDMYLVSLNEDGDTYFAVKWVNKHPTDPSKAILVSSNEHYAPREVELRHIHRIALIKFSIRYNSMG